MAKSFKSGNVAAELLEREEHRSQKQQPKTNNTAAEDLELAHTAPETVPVKHKIENPAEEVKTKRVQLVFKPSTYLKAKAKAQQHGISLNEYLHQLIEGDN